jgi:hypothetical protein
VISIFTPTSDIEHLSGYEQMARTEYERWCREHIDKTAEECGLEKSVVSDVKQAAKFCAVVSDLSECSTRSILALIRIKDEPVKNRAISLAENALKEEST